MSNTPLTQLVRLHRLYWLKVKGLSDTVPRLDIGIVNVHPVRQDAIPLDHDDVINRNNDITFSDRTEREQEGACSWISSWLCQKQKLFTTNE
jgi:NTE family protein